MNGEFSKSLCPPAYCVGLHPMLQAGHSSTDILSSRLQVHQAKEVKGMAQVSQ